MRSSSPNSQNSSKTKEEKNAGGQVTGESSSDAYAHDKTKFKVKS